MIDITGAGPVAIEKHGRAVVVVLSIEHYEKVTELRSTSIKRANIRYQPVGGYRAEQTISGKAGYRVSKS